MPLAELPWPTEWPCPREAATVTIHAEYGEAIGWADLTRADTCGRDAPSACSEALRARLDDDGMLTCRDLACAWTFPGADLDGGALWLVGRTPRTLTIDLLCDADPATGIQWDIAPSPRIEAVVVRAAGTTVHKVPHVAAPARLDPDALAGEPLRWQPVKDPTAAVAARDTVDWSRRLPAVRCPATVRRADVPDISGDGAPDVLLEVRQPEAARVEDCAKGEPFVWTLLTDAKGHAIRAVDVSSATRGRRYEPADAVRLPDGGWGLRGEVVALPDSSNKCERHGRYVIAVPDPGRVFLADTTPPTCPG